MGVAGLWEVLRPAGQVRSLTDLAVEDGFNATGNPSNQRGFRIGIDASIWFFHAAYGREGENPELRTLFFRCCRLLQSPLLPLFVFDGPNRPAIKRGKRVGGNVHWLTQGMKNIIDAFGFEWRIAPGEAEAELAYLNRIGIIDAVLSDDVDNFLFGATMVIRNPSNTLSGNRAHPVKNAQGKDDGNHVVTYKADAILSHPLVGLSRSGTVLIGLLSGGDYIPAGLPGCGQKFAAGLARAGFGDSLVQAVRKLKGARLDTFLDQWRQDIKSELRTNKSGFLPSKKPSLAASLPDDFPSLPVLVSYADPLTSENIAQKGNDKTPPIMWRNDPDPMRIASLCELYFEWGVKDVIVHRFRTVLWPGIVCRAVRRAAVNEDTRRRGAPPPSSEGDDSTAGPPSPTKRLTSTFSSLGLSSPSKKSAALDSPPSDPSTSESFTLSSLGPLSSLVSPSSSSSALPCSSTSPTPTTSPLLLEVLSQRSHASTDSTLEYRVLINPATLVERAESGVKGLRPPLVGGLFGVEPEDETEGSSAVDQDADESGTDDNTGGIERLETAAAAASKSGTKKRKARREVPTKPLRLWLPACMIRAATPALAEVYDEKVRAQEEKKAKRGTKGVRGRRAGTGVKSTSRTIVKDDTDRDGDESVPGPSISKTSTGSKTKSRATRIGGVGGRRKPKQASEAQHEAYELIDLSAEESPCSSDAGVVKENTKGRGKAKAEMGQTNPAKPTTKTDATNKKATTTDTMKGHFNTTKPSSARTVKTKPSTSGPPAVKASALEPKPLRRVYEEEEEDSADAAAPPLPKSSRPLDLLRAKSRPCTAGSNANSKSKSPATSKYEEEESSSSTPPSRPLGSKPSPSSLPYRLPAPRAKKKPLFVDVSDTDSDIEISDIRRSSSGMITVTRHETEVKTSVGDGDMSVSAGVGATLSVFASEKGTSREVSGVFDLGMKGNVSKSKNAPSTSVPATSLPLICPGPVLGADMVDPALSTQSPSKLAHILLTQSALESEEEEEGSEGDELPTFGRGSTGSRTAKKATISRPAPRPFPMHLASESPASPHPSRLREGVHEDDGDFVGIVDVFTTPRGPSPPRSPTPSPSPSKSLPVHASAGSSTSVKSSQSDGFPASPTKLSSKTDPEPHKRTVQRRNASSGWDTPISGNEKNSIHKSPRKSAAHSSPRHGDSIRGRASSPTPLASNPRSVQTGDTIEWKPRQSDASAIYISSGSEDEGNVNLGVYHIETEVNTEDQYEGMDGDVDAWADTGMILSVPPLPTPASEDPVPTQSPIVEVPLPNPARASKFKPAPAAAPKVGARTALAGPGTYAKTTYTSPKYDGGTVIPCPVRRAPLLVARSKRSKDRQHDIIDLTSD